MYKITLDIEKLPESLCLGTSPELPGLVVQGESVWQVLQLAPDVAHDLITVMVETGQALPRTIETVSAPSRRAILEKVARLSEPYGTSIVIRDGVGHVELG